MATIIGLMGGLGLVVTAMVLGGSPASFVDWPAMLIVVGGTFAVTLASFAPRDLGRAMATGLRALFRRARTPNLAAFEVLQLADRARREGLLGLQNTLERISQEPFLRRAVALIIDGTPGDEVERILQREAASIAQRRRSSAEVFHRAAEVSPAMGLIGTLVGLVQMLSHLDDPARIGPAMAVALLTTFYGAVLAYMVFSPLAAKLERENDEETLTQSLYLVGATSIGRKENPRRLEMQLNAMLPPAYRITYFD
ncbi:MAG TPA: MotA/TolQ/ExbB proton channel family protein [Alphaproteobacteria bacterium]|jgi:chemotaxis protein MotA|nr:MotA/TolQ/ExbB proton channel family protein [Alphaproteobacteria bacterium]